MLDETEIDRVSRHKISHDMGMCGCPCFAALMKVAEALKVETALRVKMAKVSPDALAALTIGADVDEGAGPEADACPTCGRAECTGRFQLGECDAAFGDSPDEDADIHYKQVRTDPEPSPVEGKDFTVLE